MVASILGSNAGAVGRSPIIGGRSGNVLGILAHNRAAPNHPSPTTLRTHRVRLRLDRIGAVPVAHPLEGSRIHVLQSPRICLLVLGRLIPCGKKVVVSGAVRILPFGLRWKTKALVFRGAQPFAKCIGVFPTYAGCVRWIWAHILPVHSE